MMYDHRNESVNPPVLGNGEEILWQGKPKKTPYIAAKSLAMLPIAVVWLFLDMGIIMSSIESGEMLYFIIPFFALHLMPVWIWLANMITAGRRWKNTSYYVTNRRIIIQSGFFAVNEISLFYKELRNVQIHIGMIDKFANTGSIRFDTGMYVNNRSNQPQHYSFEYLDDANQIYSRIQKIVLDIQTDMEYPNALRPDENPGYNTDYKG